MAIVINGSGTVSGLTEQASNVELTDNTKILVGTGDDLQMYHDGTDSYVKDNGTGNLLLQGTNLNLQSTAAENYIRCTADAQVELYHNNVKKFETTAAGVTVTGDLNTTGGQPSQVVNGADLSVNSLGIVSSLTKSIEEVHGINSTISSNGNIIIDIDFVSSTAACTFVEIELYGYPGKYLSYKHGAYWGTNWSGPHNPTVIENITGGMTVTFDGSPTAGHVKYTLTSGGLTYPIIRVKAMGGATTASTNPTITFSHNN